MSLPQITPYDEVMAEARRELGQILWEWRTRHHLTPTEAAYLLQQVQTEYLRSAVKRGKRRKETP